MTAAKVMAAYVTGGQPENDFMASYLQLKEFDTWVGPGHLSHPGWYCSLAGTNITDGRNKIVRTFLDETDADWLWFVDDDQTFPPDLLARMVESADPVKRPILSALVMAQKVNPSRIVPACVLGKMTDGRWEFHEPAWIPEEQHWEVAAVGAGCVLIHRSVLEKVGEAHSRSPWPWFADLPYESVRDGVTVPDKIGEDYGFCTRARALGFDCFVDTTIEAGHIKKRVLTSRDFWAQFPNLPARNVVVIPTKDKLPQLKSVVRALFEQGETHEIVIVDNGSNSTTRQWLDHQKFATVIDGEGLGIHQMWNLGAAHACRFPRVNVLFLNNDVEIGDGFVGRLAEGLRSDDRLMAVCPNYDGRDGDGVEGLYGICAERYDGTGGLAGFAFMCKGELFDGYQFPTDAMWWYGDNDLTLTLDQSGFRYGMVHGVTVKHDEHRDPVWSSPEMLKQLEADKQAFMAKWAR